jgi:hypothetical protein
MCPVRGCCQELDLHGHHRVVCSSSVDGRRTRLHDDNVDYLAGYLKRAGFPCTSKESTFLSTPVYGLMARSMSVGISTFLVLMAVFYKVRRFFSKTGFSGGDAQVTRGTL